MGLRRLLLLCALVAAAVLAPAAGASHRSLHGRIVFSLGRDDSNGTGAYRLLTVNPDGSGLKQLTSGRTSDVNPAWSPDGTTIAFGRGDSDSDVGDAIWTIGSDGRNAVDLTGGSHGDEPAWSPDGTTIVYVRYVHKLWQIWRMNADGSEQRLLSTSPKSTADRRPWFSHDGKTILFVRQYQSKTRYRYAIWRMNADGTQPRRVTATSKAIVWTARPSPGGLKIAYATETLHVIGADGSGDFDTKVATRENPSLSWAPDGSVVACGCGSTGSLQILDPLKRKLTLLLRLPVKGLNSVEGLDWSSR